MNATFRAKNTVLLVVVMWAVALPAKPRNWRNATVVNVESTVVSMAAWGDTNIIHYTIQTDDLTYVLDYAYNPAVKAPWPGQHSRTRAPNLTVNGKAKIVVEGEDAYVLDDDGREIKLPIAKKIARSPAPEPSK